MNPAPSGRDSSEMLRRLPSVDGLLRHSAISNLLDEFPRSELCEAVRAVLDERRREILAGERPALDVPTLSLLVRERLFARRVPSLRRVINATGIILHTGLGRAPLAQAAVDAVAEAAAGYCSLEIDLESGQRGDRQRHTRALLCELTGAEDALVVNNNAAATWLTLSTLAAGRGAVISRGELVEIGGSYRMPDIMAAAGCRMVEVGTTNRTRIGDYERAIDGDTAVLLRVHTSNYRIRGFVESATLGELVELGRRRGLAVINDLGSGLLHPLGAAGGVAENETDAAADDPRTGVAAAGSPYPSDEPTVCESVRSGADVTLFSGDKLLGGPQAGVIVGRADLLAAMRRNPLARALRADKMTLAALEATLRLYRDPQSLERTLPVYRMLLATAAELERAAYALRALIQEAAPESETSVCEEVSEAGGGSLPGVALPTWVVRVSAVNVAAVAAALRERETPVLCRIRGEALLLDPRTLLPGEAEEVAASLGDALREADGP